MGKSTFSISLIACKTKKSINNVVVAGLASQVFRLDSRLVVCNVETRMSDEEKGGGVDD